MTTSPLVPRAFPVAINGQEFMIDDQSVYGVDKFIGPISIPVNRDQADNTVTPGAASLNRQDAWRRVLTDWSHGTGQTWLDDPASDEQRFRQSKGVDVWTPGQVSLLNTTATLATASTSYSYMDVYMSVTGDSISPDAALYVYDGAVGSGTYKRLRVNSSDTLVSTTSLTGFTTGHGNSGLRRRSVTAFRGFNVYFVDGDTRVDYVGNGGTAVTNLCNITASAAQITGIWTAKHRVFAASGPGFVIFDCTPGGTIASASLTINADAGETVDITEGQAVVYIAGNYDKHGEIYSFSVDPQTSVISNLKRAARLPTGETIHCAFGYSGFVFVGTDQGFRMCAELSDGTLQVGALVNIGKPVRCFTAVAQFVYFGWSNYDGTDGGLGRIDPTSFVDPGSLVPAYASDVMATSNTNNVVDAVAFDNGGGTYKPYFLLTNKVYNKTSTTLTSGTLNTGFMTYGLSDQKVATGVDIRTSALPSSGTVAVSITNVNGGSPASVGTYSTTSGTGTKFNVSFVAGSEHELVLTLGASATAPTVSAVTLFANPVPVRGELWQIPLIISDNVTDLQGYKHVYDPFTLIAAIRTLSQTAAPTTVQIGTYSASMFIEDYQDHGLSYNAFIGAPTGTLVVTLKSLQP